MTKRQTISAKNREKKDIAILLDELENPRGLVFIAHGLGAIKEQRQLEEFARTFTESGYNVIRYDALNSIGEGEGDIEHANLTNYYQNLEDVINWAGSQKWFQEPFILLGHSLGGFSSLLYAEKYPPKVKGIVAISSGISGKLSYQGYTKDEIAEWKKRGYREEEVYGHPDIKVRINWDFLQDLLNYDTRTAAKRLTMPVIFITGELDDLTPANEQQELYKLLPGKKEFHIIKKGLHVFWEKEHFDEIRYILISWIESL